MSTSQYDHRLSVHITGAMHQRLTRLANDRNTPIAEIAREALRDYLDSQEDIQGSRKHFTKGFQRRISFVEWQLSVLLWLVSYGFSYLISYLTKLDVKPELMMRQAMQEAMENQPWMQHLLSKSALEIRKDEE
jgi:predicted DNA-binding protein